MTNNFFMSMGVVFLDRFWHYVMLYAARLTLYILISVCIFSILFCTFPKMSTRRICVAIKSLFSFMIISFIVVTLMRGSEVIF